MSIFIFSQYLFQKIEKCGVTPHCLSYDLLTLSDRRKKKWRKLKRKNHIIRTSCKSTKISYFVEVGLDCSKYANVTDNRKHGKKIIKDSRQELKNDKFKNFSGNKQIVIEEPHNTDVILSNKIDREKDSSKLEIPTKDSLLYSKITTSNTTDQKRQNELSCYLVENGTLSNISREIALFQDRGENIKKIDQGISNLSVDILSSLLKDKEKVPILTPNIQISNTSTANNIRTQGNDTSVSLSQLVMTQKMKSLLQLPSKE